MSMDLAFKSEQECKIYIESNESVYKDLDIMYPKNESYKILCLPKSTIQDMLDLPIKTVKDPEPA